MKSALAALAVIVAATVGLTFALRGEEYIPRTETLTIERDVDVDEGRQLRIEDLVATNGVRLTDIYDPTTKKFAPERQSRYGADRSGQGGEGLTINFVRKNGTAMEPFELPGWKNFEETTRPKRRQYVEDATPRLAKAVEEFVAPVGIKRAFGIALDTTEGVTPQLAKRVREIIDGTRAISLGSNAKNTVVLNLYNITEQAYQGGREQPKLTSADEVRTAIESLLTERPSRKNSSVLLGLKTVLEEMAGYRDSRPVLHIITDGLENTGTVSVYKPGGEKILDEENWAKLDQVADLASLKLAGLTIHLHPLPATSGRHAAMMQKGLKYLANRLAKATGSEVKIEPL